MKFLFKIPWRSTVIVVAIIVYTILFSYASIIRAYVLKSGAHDLGVFAQALYSTLKGLLFFETPDYQLYGVRSFFGIHFSPILFAYVPLYAVFPRFEILLIIQTIIVSIAALPLYKLALHIVKDKKLAITISILYLLNPLIHAANLYDFHLESLFPLLYYLMFLGYVKDNRKLFIISWIIMCLTIEFIQSILFFFGVYLVVKEILIPYFLGNRKPRKHCRELAIYIIPLILAPIIYIVQVNITLHFVEKQLLLSRHVESLLSFTLSGIGKDIYPRIVYLILLFAPYCFLQVLSPLELIPLMPLLILALASAYKPFYTIGWQYGLFAVPILHVSFTYSTLKFKKHGATHILFKIMVVYIILALVLCPLNPLISEKIPSGGYNVSLNLEKAMENLEAIDKIKYLIPKNSTILTSFTLFVFFANNIKTYTMFYENKYMYVPTPEYIVDYLLDVDEVVPPNINLDEYGVYAQYRNFIVYKKMYSGLPVIYEPFKVEFYPEKLIAVHNTCVYEKFKGIFCNISSEKKTFILKTPPIIIPSGKYRVTFFVFLANNQNNVIEITVANTRGEVLNNYRGQLSEGFNTISFTFNLTPSKVSKIYLECKGKGKFSIIVNRVFVEQIDTYRMSE
ncbi:MAG: hypothetical protein B6U76_00520 [Desulfurococcales archaeon ex4484_217_2]|nr:MAG: hypothetical protein B6U76_00520 [Desulfurococcales archaeon ex4484_217_2]